MKITEEAITSLQIFNLIPDGVTIDEHLAKACEDIAGLGGNTRLKALEFFLKGLAAATGAKLGAFEDALDRATKRLETMERDGQALVRVETSDYRAKKMAEADKEASRRFEGVYDKRLQDLLRRETAIQSREAEIRTAESNLQSQWATEFQYRRELTAHWLKHSGGYGKSISPVQTWAIESQVAAYLGRPFPSLALDKKQAEPQS